MADFKKIKIKTATYWRIFGVAFLVLILTFYHYKNYHFSIEYHVLLQFGYYVPVIYSGIRFGLKGGVISGLVITILLLPFIIHYQSHDLGSKYTQMVEILLVNIIGWVSGFLSQQEQKATVRYQHALEELKHEINERQKLQEEIQRTEKMSALGQLSAGLAHEIRNPLGIIKLSIQLLLKEKEKDPTVKEYCKVLLEESERLNRLVNEFLNFARPKNSNPTLISVEQLLESAAALVSPLIKQHNIKLNYDLKEAAAYVTSVDIDQMRQVFLNIFLNAVEAQPEGGEINIQVQQEEQAVLIIINDYGPGIPQDVLPNIFDPFFTTKAKGTGLGLSVVHRILEQNHGKINIINNPSGGTIVKITLPRIQL